MSKSSMTVYEPLTVHPDTLANPAFTIRDAEQERLICYCPRNNVGAVYHIEAGMWAMYVPIDLPAFVGSLADRGIGLPDGPDLQAWLDAIGAAPMDRGEAH